MECLDEAAILLKAQGDIGIQTAIQVALFKSRLANGRHSDWDDVRVHQIGNFFRDSIRKCNQIAQLAGRILRAIVQTLESSDLFSTHALRIGPGGETSAH